MLPELMSAGAADWKFKNDDSQSPSGWIMGNESGRSGYVT